MIARYAQGTFVDSSASRAEFERTVTRYGAESFMCGWQDSRAALAFTADGRQVRFILPLPNRNERRFTHTPAKNQRTAQRRQRRNTSRPAVSPDGH